MKQETQEQEKPELKGVEFSYKLSNLFNCIKHLSTINIKATPQGLEIWGMDNAGVMMTEVKIDKENIDNYKLNKETQITTEIDYLRFVKRLYLVKAYIDEQQMIFEEHNTKVEMPVFETEEREKPNLDLKKAVSFELSTSEIRKTLKDIEAVGSESFQLEFKDKKAHFSANGTYGKLLKTLTSFEKGIKRYIKTQDSIKVGLSAEYFKNALNGAENRVKITLCENAPVIVDCGGYKHETSDYEVKPDKKIRHIIAPRVEY